MRSCARTGGRSRALADTRPGFTAKALRPLRRAGNLRQAAQGFRNRITPQKQTNGTKNFFELRYLRCLLFNLPSHGSVFHDPAVKRIPQKQTKETKGIFPLRFLRCLLFKLPSHTSLPHTCAAEEARRQAHGTMSRKCCCSPVMGLVQGLVAPGTFVKTPVTAGALCKWNAAWAQLNTS